MQSCKRVCDVVLMPARENPANGLAGCGGFETHVEAGAVARPLA